MNKEYSHQYYIMSNSITGDQALLLSIPHVPSASLFLTLFYKPLNRSQSRLTQERQLVDVPKSEKLMALVQSPRGAGKYKSFQHLDEQQSRFLLPTQLAD